MSWKSASGKGFEGPAAGTEVLSLDVTRGVLKYSCNLPIAVKGPSKEIAFANSYANGRYLRSLLCPTLEQKRAICATEAEGVRHGVIDAYFARTVGNEIHVLRTGILILEIDGWGQDLVSKGEHGDAGFEAPRAAEKVTGHGLGRTDRDFVISEKVADGMSLESIADWS